MQGKYVVLALQGVSGDCGENRKLGKAVQVSGWGDRWLVAVLERKENRKRWRRTGRGKREIRK